MNTYNNPQFRFSYRYAQQQQQQLRHCTQPFHYLVIITSSIAESIGGLTDNLTQVLKDRLGSFTKRFSEENSSTVENAIKKARRESYTCKRKGN